MVTNAGLLYTHCLMPTLQILSTWVLLDVSQVEALLSLQTHMIPMALDRLINICDCKPLSVFEPRSLMSSKLKLLHPLQKAG